MLWNIFGVPSDIMSDRNARFTGQFWAYLLNFLGLELKFFTANHRQMNEQTERINALLEEFLRHYISTN